MGCSTTLLLFLVNIAGLASPAAAQDVTPAARLDALLEPLHDADRFDGVVLVAERGEIVLDGCYGLADLARQAPLRSAPSADYA